MSDSSPPPSSPWLTGSFSTAAPAPAPNPGYAGAPARQSYPLAVRDHSLGAAIGLVAQSLPYALARFGVLMAAAIAGIVWLVVTIGGAAFLTAHVAQAFGVVWFLGCVIGVGFFWTTVLRYALHLIACGHVAVLTDLITTGRVGEAGEGQFAYGKRVVTARFGQVTALFGLNALVRGVLQSFHRTLDWVGEMLPIPGMDSIANIVTMILGAATRYLDKVILSYNLARGEEDAWRGARDGIVYYCQNAKPILKTAVWIVVQEKVLSVLLWLVLLAPAAAITALLPHAVREAGGVVAVAIAVLLAATLRAAFVKPVFLAMMMVRFHALVENQPIDATWDARLDRVSEKFRSLGRGAMGGV